MKKRTVLITIGIIAFAVVIGFSFAACDDGSTDPDPDSYIGPIPVYGTGTSVALLKNWYENGMNHIEQGKLSAAIKKINVISGYSVTKDGTTLNMGMNASMGQIVPAIVPLIAP